MASGGFRARPKRVTAEDALKRIDIRAPISGIVHQLAVHTVGGVVNQTEIMMLIVLETDRLVVEDVFNPRTSTPGHRPGPHWPAGAGPLHGIQSKDDARGDGDLVPCWRRPHERAADWAILRHGSHLDSAIHEGTLTPAGT